MKNSKISKKKHIKNYFWNLFAALIGGFTLVGIYSWKMSGPINEIISILALIILFVAIMVWRNKYLKA
jgi:amino acid transporter